ncbi:glutathione S-transferase family protein [Roseococcus pinisoli]|uniref:Glutathione S-transferase family protein n=1 Tax=Roseococcus pinisoli TaxID=2835040 RepID=A0ABS5Q7Y2_9PROT|nr:glutathione S-transferase family protein [Roseococcus pinisoli]MBS7809498.1 glutathione S-transferase family protein [Roseococcus pinisoli]
MLTFYYSPNACSLASHIALEEAGAAYEPRRVDFGAGQQKSADYMALNPKARVPALVTSRGVLTETPAILVFIAQSFPEARLAPLDDAFALAEMQAFNSYLCSTVHVAHAHKVRGTRWADEESSFADMRRKVPETMSACAELLETHLLKGPWVMGEAFTVADPYLFTIVQWMKGDGVDLAAFPRLSAHRANMAERPSVKKILARESAA